jgi:H+/Cl- antiporter ClcA
LFKHSLYYLLKWVVITLAISIPIGAASSFFLHTLNLVTDFREANIWIIIGLPFCGYLISYMYDKYGQSFESGSNLLLDTIDDPFKPKISILKAVFIYTSTLLTHLFGGSAGREGTAIQMAGSIADQFTEKLTLSAEERKILLIAAIAAGFGSVFGTPFAGAIFAIEVIFRGKIAYQYLLPALFAAIFADGVGHILYAPHTHYAINSKMVYSSDNIISAIGVGIVFGLVSRFFINGVHELTNLSRKYIPQNPIRTMVGGLLVLLMFALVRDTQFLGLGVPSIIASFSSQLGTFDFAIKLLFTIVTLSFGFKGGEVTPLFFIGATLGNALQPLTSLPLDLIAGMGFVGVFAGATNTPIACAIMAMELFGWECGLFVAIGCVVSYHISGIKSIYSSQKFEIEEL